MELPDEDAARKVGREEENENKEYIMSILQPNFPMFRHDRR